MNLSFVGEAKIEQDVSSGGSSSYHRNGCREKEFKGAEGHRKFTGVRRNEGSICRATMYQRYVIYIALSNNVIVILPRLVQTAPVLRPEGAIPRT
jgi:hypothetical protein